MTQILNKLSVLLFAVAMTISLAFGGLTTTTKAETMSVAQMMQLIAQLQAQLAALDGGSTTTTTSTTTEGEYLYRPNKSIDYEFTKTLKIGSRGEEVTMLQKALDMKLETKGIAYGYFGTMTGDAVKAFQVANGYPGTPVPVVGPWTRAKLNAKAVVTVSTTPTTTVSGDVLAVSGEAADDMRIGNSQKAIFSKITLTAGDENVKVKDIIVEISGEASETNDFEIDRVLLLDSAKIQLDYDSSLNSSNKAKLDADVTIKSGQSMDFYIAAKTDSDVSPSDNLDVTLTVTDVVTDGAEVEGTPVKGADMLLNHNLSLDDYSTTIADEATEVAIGDKDVVFATVTVNNPSAGDDDFVLRSMKIEETGDIDEQDSLDNVAITFDGKTYEGTYKDHEYTFDFGNDGIDVEDGEDVELNLQGDVVDGAGKNIAWKVTDSFVVDEDGAILTDTNAGSTTSTLTVDSYGVVINKTTDVSNGNISAGDNDVELASFKVEAKGGEDMTGKLNVEFALSGTVPSDYSDVTLTDVGIYNTDGDLVSSTEEVEWSAQNTVNVEFSDVQFKSDTDPIDYVIKADINDDATNGAIYTVVQLGHAGKTFFDIEVDSNESISDVTAVTTMGAVKIVKGAAIKVAILGTLDDQTVKSDSSNVELAKVQLDTVASGREINVKKLAFKFVVTDNGANTPTINDLDDCALYDGDTVVSGTVNVDSQYETFTLNDGGYKVAAGIIKALSLRCSITDEFLPGDTIDVTLKDTGAAGTADDSEYNFRDGTTKINATVGNNTSAQIVISSASVVVSNDEEPTAVTAKVADTVELGTVKLDPTDVTGTVTELPLKINSTAGLNADGKVEIYAGSTHVADAYFSNTTTTVDTFLANIDLADGTVTKLTFKAKLAGAVSTEGQALAVNVNAGNLKVGNDTYVIGSATTLNGVKVYSGLAKIEKETVTATAGANKEVLVYKVTAEGEDIVVTNLVPSASAGTVDDGEFGYSSESTGATLTNTAMYYGTSRNDATNAVTATGTIATTSGSTAVVGSGTLFNTEVSANDQITVEGVTYTVASVTDNTHLTLSANASATVSGKKYTNISKGVTVTAGTTEYFVVRGDVTLDTGEYIAVEADLTGTFKVKTIAISPIEADNLSLDDFDSTDEAVLENLAK